jgi:hypothetical protein
MEDWEAKVDKIVEETEHENMTLISGNSTMADHVF